MKKNTIRQILIEAFFLNIQAILLFFQAILLSFIFIFIQLFFIFMSSTVIAQGPPPAKVVIDKVKQGIVAQTRSVTGILYYDRVSDLSTEVAGLVKSVSVNQGDVVKKGQPLV